MNDDPDVNNEAELNLAPRDQPPITERRTGSVRNKIIGGVVGAALLFIVYQGLTNARVFFLNVDEAIAQRDDLGDRTFRMQGTVITEDEATDAGALLFTVAFDDATARIRHVGPEPSDLFDLGEPVVVEGHWDGEVFVSNQILVKHDESYVEDNPNRVEYDVDDPAVAS